MFNATGCFCSLIETIRYAISVRHEGLGTYAFVLFTLMVFIPALPFAIAADIVILPLACIIKYIDGKFTQ